MSVRKSDIEKGFLKCQRYWEGSAGTGNARVWVRNVQEGGANTNKRKRQTSRTWR
jgi:hypothetical protein